MARWAHPSRVDGVFGDTSKDRSPDETAASTPVLPLRVLIAGGGVAALEAGLALQALAGDRVSTRILAPDDRFVMRPLEVREPFAGQSAPHYDLAELAASMDASLIRGRLTRVDAADHAAFTDTGHELVYDVLIIGMGADARPSLPHARMVHPGRLDELLRGFVQDVEGEYVKSAAFIVPERVGWPLPLYELLFMTADRAYSSMADLSLTLISSERRPLEAFGEKASAEVQRRLDQAGITVLTSARVEIPGNKRVTVIRGGQRSDLEVDSILALPELFGPAIEGLPSDDNGFVPVDEFGRVTGAPGVFAAGDATNGVLKQGGVAAQQAEVVARTVAALAGAPVEPTPFRPRMRGVMLTGNRPILLDGDDTGPLEPGAALPPKIVAERLAPFLAARA